MRGLYESILDDEADVLNRSDRDADLLLWSEILFDSGMLNKGQFRIKPGSAIGKFELEYFGKVYTPITFKFLSERLYKHFSEACEGIYIYSQNMMEMIIGFDFDFGTLPHFYNLDGNGYDEPFRTGTTHINLSNSSYTLYNLNPENLGIRKKTTLPTILKIFGSVGRANVVFKDFSWDVPNANVIFEDIYIKNTRHIELSVREITASNVDVDNTADDETKKISILSHVRGDSRNTNGQLSFSNGVLKLIDTTTTYTARGNLSGIGIKTIIGDEASLYNVTANDVHLISSMKRLGVVPSTPKYLTFDNYRSKPKIQVYSLNREVGGPPPIMKISAWCDTTHDKHDWKDWDEVSSLNFIFYVDRGALNQVHSNCMLVRFADASSQIVTDIQKLLKKHRYVSDEELETVIPLHNFANLKFIIWNAGLGEGIVKTPKGWHLK